MSNRAHRSSDRCARYAYSVSPAKLNCDPRYVPNFDLMPHSSPVFTGIVRSSYGTHLLDHLAADAAGLAGGKLAVIAIRKVHTDLAGSLHLKAIHRFAGLRIDKMIALVGRHLIATPFSRIEHVFAVSEPILALTAAVMRKKEM